MGHVSLTKEYPDDIANFKLFAVFKEATRLIQQHAYLFFALVCSFYLPYIFINLVLLLCLNPYTSALWHYLTGEPSLLADLSGAKDALVPIPQFILFVLLCRLLSIALLLLLATALAFSVAQIYSTGEPTYSAVLEQLPQLFPKICITILWSASILLLFEVASSFIIVFIYNLLKDLGITNAPYFTACLLSIVVSCVLYLSILWLLSIVIPALENSVGKEALVRSAFLIVEKKCVALKFILIFQILRIIGVSVLQAWMINYQYEYLPVKVFVLVLLLVAASIVALHAHVMLPVLYFSAKAFHEQSHSGFIEGYKLMKTDI